MRQVSSRARALVMGVAGCLALGVGATLTAQAPVHINGAIDKLQKGQALVGAIMYDFSLYAARQFATSDLDIIILDMEHQALDFERLQMFFLGMTDKSAIAKQGNLQMQVPPIVRIPTYGRDINESIVKQVLDIGAFGIMYPAIETADQALAAVRASRYPPVRGAAQPEPRGVRGNGNMPASWFWGLSRPEYSLRADTWPLNPRGELLLLMQIETIEGVKNAEAIARVPGVGMIFVGPNDLSQALGVPGGHPDHEAAIQQVLKVCLATKVPCAITVTAADVAKRLKEGFKFVSLPSGGLEVQMDDARKIARSSMPR